MCSSQLSKDVHEIVKHAISLDQKRFRLSEYTSFRRIIPAEGHFDPFDGKLLSLSLFAHAMRARVPVINSSGTIIFIHNMLVEV